MPGLTSLVLWLVPDDGEARNLGAGHGCPGSRHSSSRLNYLNVRLIWNVYFSCGRVLAE